MAAEFLKTRLSDTRIIISTQVLSEFYSVMTKYKRPHSEIVSSITDIIRCTNVTGVSLSTIELCLKLKEKYGYSYWDSLILAAAVENDCGTLYSEDMSHGHTIEGRLTIQNPFMR
jgi:predicted nucleic acid-binding protein